MKKRSLYFTGPEELEIREEKVEPIGKNEVLVETEISSISSGTEVLFYKNQVGQDNLIDEEIEVLKKNFEYPFKYGYSCVGRITRLGNEVPEKWSDRLVFSFNPHESRFVKSLDKVIPVPEGISKEDASFLPTVETATNLLLDGRPIIGEDVVVIGQGPIGLLTTRLLRDMPLRRVISLDKYQKRRELSEDLGADLSLKADVSPEDLSEKAGTDEFGADIVYELSGDPNGLEKAVRLVRREGRIVVGSWYGDKSSGTKLGTDFHRKGVKIISSQVSSISSRLSGRWEKSRRTKLAWNRIKKINPERLITHRFPLEEAKDAYHAIDQNKDEVIQVVFEYD